MGLIKGILMSGNMMGLIKGDTRSLEYSSHDRLKIWKPRPSFLVRC